MEDPHQPIYDPCDVHKNASVESKGERAARNSNYDAAEQLSFESESLCHKITYNKTISKGVVLLFLLSSKMIVQQE